MPHQHKNRVRERRIQHGISQKELARLIGIARQNLARIEREQVLTGVDIALNLAHVFGCTVEDLFGDAPSRETLAIDNCSVAVGSRILVASISNHWKHYPLSGQTGVTSADGIVVKRVQGRALVETFQPPEALRENIILMGCASGLGLLAQRVNSVAGRGRFIWIQRSSGDSLKSLSLGETHIAGIHPAPLHEDKTHIGVAEQLKIRESIGFFALGLWEIGIISRKNAGRAIKSIEDLAIPGLRLTGREKSAGTQRLLEQEFRRRKLPKKIISHPHLRVNTHTDVANSIILGAADVGIAPRDIATAFDLNFLPLAEERFDLAITRSHLEDKRVQRLLDVLASARFRRELSALQYDSSLTGSEICEFRND